MDFGRYQEDHEFSWVGSATGIGEMTGTSPEFSG